MNFYCNKKLYVATIIGILLATPTLYANERLPASEAFSAGTKDFLSDPARTGSLLGSILAGAAVANPLAPLLGSVAGFMIGKSSAFSNKDDNASRRHAYINRSLIPDEGGLQIQSLSGLTGNSPQGLVGQGIQDLPESSVVGFQSERGDILELSEGTQARYQAEPSEKIVIQSLAGGAGVGSRSNQTVALGLTGNIQKQLAQECSNVGHTHPVSPLCYYNSQ